MHGPQTTRPSHVRVVRRLELVSNVEPVEIERQVRCRVSSVAEATDRNRATFGQAEGDDRRVAVVSVGRWTRLQRLGQTAVSDDVDPFYRRCTGTPLPRTCLTTSDVMCD